MSFIIIKHTDVDFVRLWVVTLFEAVARNLSFFAPFLYKIFIEPISCYFINIKMKNVCHTKKQN